MDQKSPQQQALSETTQQNTSFQDVRGNKTVRLVVIGVLILVVLYLLYSVW